jgi:hypothetical protein
MNMALDDIIMQERNAKRKKIRQKGAAIRKAKSKASPSTGPQRTRDVGHVEIRAKAKPYASVSIINSAQLNLYHFYSLTMNWLA